MGGNAWPVPHSLLGYFSINLKGLLALLFVGIRMVVGIIGMRGWGERVLGKMCSSKGRHQAVMQASREVRASAIGGRKWEESKCSCGHLSLGPPDPLSSVFSGLQVQKAIFAEQLVICPAGK